MVLFSDDRTVPPGGVDGKPINNNKKAENAPAALLCVLGIRSDGFPSALLSSETTRFIDPQKIRGQI